MGAEVYLSLGSNRGDRRRNIEGALLRLEDHPGVELIRVSGLYDTEPMYLEDQPRFLNAVAELRVELDPRRLLELCRGIEAALGREKTVRYGPRAIDLDILSYGRETIDEPDLKIPHPRLAERRFVLVPLRELNPEWRHPVSGKTVGELLEALGNSQEVELIKMTKSE